MHRRQIAFYLLRRLFMLVPLAFGVTLVVFLLASLIPGGPVAALLAGHATDTATIEALREKYHLNDPLYAQYGYWLSGVARGDLGTSIVSGQPVSAAILDRIGTTLALNIAGVVLALGFGISLGVTAAVRRGGTLDRAVVSATQLLSGAPPFVLAIALLFVFGFQLGWFPLFGIGGGGLPDTVRHLALPAIVVAIGPLAFLTKITRAAMIDQLDQDYVTFARARGIGFRRVLWGHAFRNALVPVLTAAGLLFVGLLTGTVFVETVFGLPGLGRLLVTSVQFNDFPVTQGIVLIVAAWIVLTNLVVDLLYALVDPRVDFAQVAR
jgi:peptide/nickel transport system permease protein